MIQHHPRYVTGTTGIACCASVTAGVQRPSARRASPRALWPRAAQRPRDRPPAACRRWHRRPVRETAARSRRGSPWT